MKTPQNSIHFKLQGLAKNKRWKIYLHQLKMLPASLEWYLYLPGIKKASGKQVKFHHWPVRIEMY
jgi:hypothetical protein